MDIFEINQVWADEKKNISPHTLSRGLSLMTIIHTLRSSSPRLSKQSCAGPLLQEQTIARYSTNIDSGSHRPSASAGVTNRARVPQD